MALCAKTLTQPKKIQPTNLKWSISFKLDECERDGSHSGDSPARKQAILLFSMVPWSGTVKPNIFLSRQHEVKQNHQERKPSRKKKSRVLQPQLSVAKHSESEEKTNEEAKAYMWITFRAPTVYHHHIYVITSSVLYNHHHMYVITLSVPLISSHICDHSFRSPTAHYHICGSTLPSLQPIITSHYHMYDHSFRALHSPSSLHMRSLFPCPTTIIITCGVITFPCPYSPSSHICDRSFRAPTTHHHMYGSLFPKAPHSSSSHICITLPCSQPIITCM
ncbi:hypothetical protein AVEN_96421-1 [Araneus ventricosus]|uniref:Uncharacterized protein n=1 Tax=Araneus ventricosus TaxID=182803 RepID=A0A4Y2HXD8_ARAVE|nr:hypothetical protein AVEN_96421-1 [Araneus ventricosus]